MYPDLQIQKVFPPRILIHGFSDEKAQSRNMGKANGDCQVIFHYLVFLN